MPATSSLRKRLIAKLQELFQLDQPDLDFGFYRIMHAKAEQVTAFLERDLLGIIAGAVGEVDEAKRRTLQAEYDQALELARRFEVPNPEETEPVRAVKEKLARLQEATTAEGEIYDHLYRFFSRYYDEGDFLSQRFYGRETAGRAATYAIPYSGEEVKLHWANADQFYIKTAEYFNRFTVNLREAPEVKANRGALDLGLKEAPLRVTLTLVAGAEGEHGNVKAGDSGKRFFRIDEANPVALSEAGELLINFVYRPDPEKSGTEGKWREVLNQQAVERVLTELAALKASEPRYGEFLNLLKTPAPTEKQKERPLLAKYINQYTARNTMDYFIHKDLGSFLRRELDFYIKNEMMRLDDIEEAEAPAVEDYLRKVQVLRKIARQLIDFLAQLEDFQKKLWLKKKFVTETQYCLTLDRIPESFYPEIAANETQRREWVRLFAIDEIQGSEGDLLTAGSVGYSEPLTVAFLRQNPFLVLDTAFFSADFKARLVATIDNFDDQCDGLLIHSENFQALNLLQERYREQVKCVYIDPPYNTGGDGFAYKDNYQHSSWLSMFLSRLEYLFYLMSGDSIFWGSIDDNQISNMKSVLNKVFGNEKFESQIIIQSNKRGQTYQSISKTHEYLLCYMVGDDSEICELPKEMSKSSLKDEVGFYELWELRNRNPKFGKHNRPNLYYPLYVNINSLDSNGYAAISIEKTENFSFEVLPKNSSREDSCWRWSKNKVKEELFEKNLSVLVAKQKRDGGWNIYEKSRKSSTKPKTIWNETEVINEQGTVEVGGLGFSEFGFPKPTGLLKKVLQVSSQSISLVLDYFAGSGTTAHAVINLNREDGGQRKYILVEMGEHFDTVLKPRIQKVVYAKNWKDGKPVFLGKGGNSENGEGFGGVSHCFKYLRLESYEDTLNNLELKPVNSTFLRDNEQLKREYLLRYMLDIETKGSQSLLNIDNFANPTDYRLKIKTPGADEYQEKAVDLIETFNYLIGLRVIAIDAPQRFGAEMERQADPELPAGQTGKLVIKGKLKSDPNGPWWFRKIDGAVPKNPHSPNDGLTENVLIVWRNLTGDLEQDNLVLDEWFQQNRINPRDFEYDIIYVNGSNNLPNLLREEDHWKVRLIEETFHQKMWDMGGF